MSAQGTTTEPVAAAVPFRPGFLVGDFSAPEGLRLAGSRCNACGIALFGQRHRCENCSSADLQHVAFAKTGVVHTYTVQRYAPPPPHALSTKPWQPRPIAWIDIDENGPRILGPISCSPEDVGIGMKVQVDCSAGWQTADGTTVIAYAFAPMADKETAA